MAIQYLRSPVGKYPKLGGRENPTQTQTISTKGALSLTTLSQRNPKGEAKTPARQAPPEKGDEGRGQETERGRHRPTEREGQSESRPSESERGREGRNKQTDDRCMHEAESLPPPLFRKPTRAKESYRRAYTTARSTAFDEARGQTVSTIHKVASRVHHCAGTAYPEN